MAKWLQQRAADKQEDAHEHSHDCSDPGCTDPSHDHSHDAVAESKDCSDPGCKECSDPGCTDPSHDHSHDHSHDAVAESTGCSDPGCTDPSHDHSHDNRQETTAAQRFGIRTFVYAQRRPFMRDRFDALLKALPFGDDAPAGGPF